MNTDRNISCAIQLFGGLQVKVGGETLARFATRKATGLLALLAFAPRRAHSREQAAEWLWPNEPPDVTRKRLRQTLAVLRHALEPPSLPAQSLLKADRATLQLDAHAVRTDVDEYEEILHTAHQTPEAGTRITLLKQALTLYQGELLEGFYEEWILPERERLAETRRQALQQLVTLLESEGAFEQGIGFARQAVAADLLDEEAHRSLMRLYSRVGRLPDALRQFRELERLLKEQVNAAPSPATQRLLEQLMRSDFASPTSSKPTVSAAASLYLPDRVPQEAALSGLSLPMASLPSVFTRFLGREKEIEQITGLLSRASVTREDAGNRAEFGNDEAIDSKENTSLLFSDSEARLVTLTGTGGTGKTRLAVETAKRLSSSYEGRIWFVSLANLTDPGRIVGTILEALHVPRLPRIKAIDQLAETLKLPTLLVLDNMEQLLDFPAAEPAAEIRARDESAYFGADREACAAVIRSLLERIPNLNCLATSRQRLGIAGEREFAVPALPIPRTPELPERLLEFAGIQLFVDRAQAACASFRLTKDNSTAVAALCHHLEGIPLAIELAAGWAALLTPEQMLEHSVRSDHLASRQKDVPARHRTLAASIEWSYRLLPLEMQRLFALLSVFHGGWNLEAAESVALPPASGSLVSLERLAQLRDRSLVTAERAGSEMRFRMLETLREFASRQLTQEERDHARQRHASHFLQLAEIAELPLKEGKTQVWLEQLEREHYNLLAALDWYKAQASVQHDDDESARNRTEEGMRLVGALYSYWDERGLLREGCDYALALLNKTESVSPGIRAKTLFLAAKMADNLSDLATAYRLLEEALILVRQLGDRAWEADILNRLGVVSRDRNDYGLALDVLRLSLVLRKDLEDSQGIAVTLADLGNVARDLGDVEQAQDHYLKSLAICRKHADKRGIAYALKALGVLAQEQGNLQSARQFFQESLTFYRELHHRWGIAYGLNSLGRLACEEGDLKTARNLLAEGMAIRRDIADRWSISQSLETIAIFNIHLRDFRRAVRLMGAAEKLHQQMQSALPPGEHAEYIRYTEKACAALGEAVFTAAWAEGHALSLEAAILLALEGAGA